MISIINRSQLDLDYLLANASKEHTLNAGDFISISLPYPFKEELYDKKLEELKNLIEQKKIKCTNGYVNLVFDLVKSRPGYYDGWKFIIDYAKKHNIKFKINSRYATSPLELENYIEKFSKTFPNGKKELLFSHQFHSLNNNIITSPTNEIFDQKALSVQQFPIDSNLIKNVRNNFNIQSPKILSLHLKNEDLFGKNQLKITKSFIKSLKTNYKNDKVDLCLFSKHYYFTNKEFKNLLKLENYIKKTYNKDYELKFYTGNDVINKRQILKANSMISSIVKDLKTSKLSPYEKLIYVRKLLTEKAYNYENESSQDLYSSLTSKQIVCVSYSLIFKAIFDELNDPNIKVNTQIYNNVSSNSIYHALNNVYVNDKKYKIEGYYDTDLTNSPSNSLKNFMISHCDTFNSCNEKKIEKVDFFTLKNLLDNKRICYFSKSLDEHDYTINSIIEKNTLKYLNTPLGKRAILKAKKQKYANNYDYLYNAIGQCIDNSAPIPIEKTKQALETVSRDCFKMDECSARNYAYNVVIETIFNSLFDYDRDSCKNSFATSSLKADKLDKIVNDNLKSQSNLEEKRDNQKITKKRSFR